MLNYKVLVINLERSPERLAAIRSQLDAIGVPFERINAFDGKTLSDEFIEKVSPADVVTKTYHRALSKAEVACSLSHKKAWQQIIDDGLDFGVVLEDDVELLDNFKDVLTLLAELPHTEWDFIKLYALRRGGGKNIAKRFDFRGHTFVTYHRYPLGFVGQAVSRQGAESLVRNLPYVTEPVDGQLKSWWEAGVYPFGLVPYCITTDLDGVSDINPGGGLEEMEQNRVVKIKNKIRRASMRLWSTPKLNQKFREFTQSLEQAAGP
jgi:glycosyl transferase family 25